MNSSFRDLMYSMGIIVNNELYASSFLRVDIKYSHNTHIHTKITMGGDGYIN